MNYLRLYNNIIDQSVNRSLDCYVEHHHIIPKCLGGSDSKSNMAILTAREHFICHWLLTKILPDNRARYALWCMINGLGIQRQRYRPSGRLYERLRLKFVEDFSRSNPAKRLEVREKMSRTRRKLGIRPPSQKGKHPNLGSHPSKETRKKMSEVHKGKKLSRESIIKRSNSRREKKEIYYGK